MEAQNVMVKHIQSAASQRNDTTLTTMLSRCRITVLQSTQKCVACRRLTHIATASWMYCLFGLLVAPVPRVEWEAPSDV